MLRIGWFSTARGSTSRKLLQAVQENIDQHKIDGQIIFTFVNRNPGDYPETDQFFKLARNYGIPTVHLSLREFQSDSSYKSATQDKVRAAYDRAVIEKLSPYSPDICVLAGYMLIVGEEMCRKYDMINLHPALPDGPKGTWQQVIWDLIEKKADRSGVMMHLVTPELDRGPVITYCSYPIIGMEFDEHWKNTALKTLEEMKQEGEYNPLFQAIRKHGVARELPLIVATLRAFSSSEISIKNGKLVDSDGNPITGYDVTHDVEVMAKESLNRQP